MTNELVCEDILQIRLDFDGRSLYWSCIGNIIFFFKLYKRWGL